MSRTATFCVLSLQSRTSISITLYFRPTIIEPKWSTELNYMQIVLWRCKKNHSRPTIYIICIVDFCTTSIFQSESTSYHGTWHIYSTNSNICQSLCLLVILTVQQNHRSNKENRDDWIFGIVYPGFHLISGFITFIVYESCQQTNERFCKEKINNIICLQKICVFQISHVFWVDH